MLHERLHRRTTLGAHTDVAPAAVEPETAFRMEGAMLVLGALLPGTLVKQAKYRQSLEGLAQQFLLPLFASPHAFLRSKAVWLAGQYASELEFTAEGAAGKKRGQGALFDTLFDHVLACMKDPCAPCVPRAVPTTAAVPAAARRHR